MQLLVLVVVVVVVAALVHRNSFANELPILLTMTRVQNSIVIKVQIFLFLVFLTVPVGFKLTMFVRRIKCISYMHQE